MLDGTTEGLLQGFVTDEYGNSHLARLGILIVSGIASNLYSVKAAASKGIALIFYIENPRRLKMQTFKASFQLVYGDLMGPFTPAAHGGYKYASKITD